MAAHHSELRRIAAALQVSEDRLTMVLEGTGIGLWEWDVTTGVIRWSSNVGPLYGLASGASPESFDAYQALIHPEDREPLQQLVQQAFETGTGFTREYRALWPDGRTIRWLQSRAQVICAEDGTPLSILGVITDVTDRKRREHASEYLAEAGALLAQSLEEEPTLERLAQLAVPRLGDWCAVHLVDPDGTLDQLVVAHQDPSKVELARSLNERYPPIMDAPTGVPAVIRSGRSELYPEIPEELLDASAHDETHLQLIKDLHLRSVLIVPIVARDRTLGAITFVFAESGREYDSHDLELAEELGRRAGLAISNVRLYATAQGAAVTLQRSLLQEELPAVAGLQTAARYLPGADGAQIGGDWYDVMPLRDGRVAVVVGDVMGRGLEAAARMGHLRTALRSFAFTCADPAKTLALMREYVTAHEVVEFATALILFIDSATGRVEASTAGHLPPVLITTEGVRLAEIASAPPLGPFEADSALTEFTLANGATLLIYTDGMVERRDAPIDDSLQQLLEASVEAARREPGDLIDHVLSRMLPGGAHHDDVAVLAVRRT